MLKLEYSPKWGRVSIVNDIDGARLFMVNDDLKTLEAVAYDDPFFSPADGIAAFCSAATKAHRGDPQGLADELAAFRRSRFYAEAIEAEKELERI